MLISSWCSRGDGQVLIFCVHSFQDAASYLRLCQLKPPKQDNSWMTYIKGCKQNSLQSLSIYFSQYLSRFWHIYTKLFEGRDQISTEAKFSDFIKYPVAWAAHCTFLTADMDSRARQSRYSAASTWLNRNHVKFKIWKSKVQTYRNVERLTQWPSVFPPTRRQDPSSLCTLVGIDTCRRTRAQTHTHTHNLSNESFGSKLLNKWHYTPKPSSSNSWE